MRLASLLPILSCLSLATAGISRRQSEDQSASVPAAPGSVDTSGTTTTVSPTTAVSAPSTEQNSEAGVTASSSDIDSDAGASGTQAGSFSLSRGGLIAVIVVVAFVAVFGIASTVLWVLAKRRQWNIRQSIRRASRRFTGRAARDATRERRSRRVGVQMNDVTKEHTHKRGMIVRVDDAEKGALNQPSSTSRAVQQESKWTEKLWRNDWQK